MSEPLAIAAYVVVVSCAIALASAATASLDKKMQSLGFMKIRVQRGANIECPE